MFVVKFLLSWLASNARLRLAAIQANIAIICAFVAMHNYITTASAVNAELAQW